MAKLRITGGEPLVRRSILWLFERLDELARRSPASTPPWRPARVFRAFEPTADEVPAFPPYGAVPQMTITPEAFRARAMEHGLSSNELDPNPVRQFQRWFEDAIATGIPEPNGMSLATMAKDGQPWLRTVLLKLYDENGFVFFTNYESSKSKQMGEHPQVALLFPWVALARQVQITGTASRISTAESLKYFATRPRGSQIGAWASPQSQAITSRSLLEAKVDQIKRKFSQGEIPLPDFWGGFRVEPATIEFWQGRESRLHDRFRYSRTTEGDWRIDRLAP